MTVCALALLPSRNENVALKRNPLGGQRLGSSTPWGR
jgi:hypothetical protein